MSGRKKAYAIGDRLRIVWFDYANHTNVALADATPARCWTEGTLAKEADKYLALKTSQYIDAKGEPEDEGDFTIIIRGGIESIEKI